MTILGVNDVTARTHLSRTTVWRMVNAGDFPKPARIGGRKIFWPEHEIDSWLSTRMDARRAS